MCENLFQAGHLECGRRLVLIVDTYMENAGLNYYLLKNSSIKHVNFSRKFKTRECYKNCRNPEQKRLFARKKCSGKCSCDGKIKFRKNLKSFTRAEKKKLKEQLVKMKLNGGLATFGEIHTIWAVHGLWDTTFLPWHRLHLAQLEHSLGMGLPFWDWTEDRLPDFFNEIFDYRHISSEEKCPSPKEWTERKQITRLEPMRREEEEKVIAGLRG